MVGTVEICWLDLKRVKLESEMNTATMISQIEKLLPPSQMDFMIYLQFLLEEKSAIGIHGGRNERMW